MHVEEKNYYLPSSALVGFTLDAFKNVFRLTFSLSESLDKKAGNIISWPTSSRRHTRIDTTQGGTAGRTEGSQHKALSLQRYDRWQHLINHIC